MRLPGFSLLLCLVLGCALSGCVSGNPKKFGDEVREWVPIGTSAAEAQRIMEHHGFECQVISKDHPFNTYGVAYLECNREQVVPHDWEAKLFLQDGKVSGYGAMTVDADAP